MEQQEHQKTRDALLRHTPTADVEKKNEPPFEVWWSSGGWDQQKCAYDPTTATHRQFADKTVAELATAYKAKTSVQAEQEADPYLWQWVNLSAPVRDVQVGKRVILVEVDVPRGTTYSQIPIAVQLLFELQVHAKLRELVRGDVITVNGQLRHIQGYMVILFPCELIESGVGV